MDFRGHASNGVGTRGIHRMLDTSVRVGQAKILALAIADLDRDAIHAELSVDLL